MGDNAVMDLTKFKNLLKDFISDESVFGFDAPTTQNKFMKIREVVLPAVAEKLSPEKMAHEEFMKGNGATHHIDYRDTESGNLESFYLKKSGKVWHRWIFNREWQQCNPSFWVKLLRIRKLRS